jgi:hypothetical protein
MSTSALAPLLLFLTLGACSAPSSVEPAAPTTTDARARSESADGGAPRVFVEAMIVDVPDDRRASLARWSFAQIAARSDLTVVASPSLLTRDRAPAHMFIHSPRAQADAVGEELFWLVDPELLEHDEVRLDLDLVSKALRTPMHTSLAVHASETVVVGTQLSNREGHTLVVLLRANVVRTEDDLRAIFERKMKEQQSAADGG